MAVQSWGGGTTGETYWIYRQQTLIEWQTLMANKTEDPDRGTTPTGIWADMEKGKINNNIDHMD